MYCHSERLWNCSFLQNDDEPLNSDDDVEGESDEEGGGDFETEDTIVCQWEKVATRNTIAMTVSYICCIILSIKFMRGTMYKIHAQAFQNASDACLLHGLKKKM